jgi:hypothetical protein
MGGSNPNMAEPQQVAQPSVALNTTGGGNSPLGFYEAKPWKVPDFTPKEAEKSKGAGGSSGADAGKMAGQLLKMYLASKGGGSPSNFSSMDSFNESFTPTGNYQPPI